MVTLSFWNCFPFWHCLDMMLIRIRIHQKAVMSWEMFGSFELAWFSGSLVANNIRHWFKMSIICNFGWINRLSFFRHCPVHLPLNFLGKKGVGKSVGFNLWLSWIELSSAISTQVAQFEIIWCVSSLGCSLSAFNLIYCCWNAHGSKFNVVQSLGTVHVLKDTVFVGTLKVAMNGLCVSKSLESTTSPATKKFIVCPLLKLCHATFDLH